MSNDISAALILAAGEGSRLGGGPKAAIKIAGRTLADRVISLIQADARVERLVVSVGHDAASVKALYDDAATQVKLPVQFVQAPDWRKGNGASALAARDALSHDRRFFLLMSDHLFEPSILSALRQDPPAGGEICLAVDFKKASIFDLDDVTRVRVSQGRIVEIGKRIDPWNAGDTGCFLCTGGLFEGLSTAAARGEHGLSDGIRELSRHGRARVVDVRGAWWQDIDTPEALAAAEARLTK